MFFQKLSKDHPVPVGLATEALLGEHKNNWYEIKVGKMFEPDTGEVTDTILYHVVNRITDIIEYQGHHLPAVLNMAKQLGIAMDTYNSLDKVEH